MYVGAALGLPCYTKQTKQGAGIEEVTPSGMTRLNSGSLSTDGQRPKGVRWIPWRIQPKKDAAGSEIPWGVANTR